MLSNFPFSRMLKTLVFSETLFYAEFLPAKLAVERLLAKMQILVAFVNVLSVKRLPAIFTLKRLYPAFGMTAQVRLEERVQNESLVAIFALERFLVLMEFEMKFQAPLGAEYFTAVLAL